VTLPVIMDIRKLNKKIKSRGIKHFQAEELGKHYNAKWKGDNFILPPESMWGNMMNTLRLADEIREELGKPLIVWSAYRSPEYNKTIGGSSNSQHKQFRALDLHVQGDNFMMLISTAAKLVQKYRNNGYEVGLGIYPNFIHIDVGFKSRFWVG